MTSSEPQSSRLAKLSEAVVKRRLQLDLLEKQLTRAKKDLDATRSSLIIAEKARELLNLLVDARKRQTLDKIEALVTHGLKSVFENTAYKFEVEGKIVRKQLAYVFKLSDGKFESGDIENTRGGGIVNVISFLLAVVVQLLLEREARFFVIDEKFAHVAVRFLPNIADLLKAFAERMDIQFLMISHHAEHIESADVSYKVVKGSDGVSTIKRLN